jgi:hypothetical protein
MCADVAEAKTYPRRRRGLRRSKSTKLKPTNAVQRGYCRSCGLVGEHPSLFDCITALRDKLATLR